MAAPDPVSGPLTRDELRQLAETPYYGAAREAIRKHDPFYGRAEGEKIKWRVTFTRELTEHGTAIVEAASEEDAMEAAEKLEDSAISWGTEYSFSNVYPDYAEPA